MEKYKIIIFLIILLNYNQNIFGQSLNELKKYEGIWIAKDYYNSFLKTKSAILSRKAFSPDNPVGLRININEYDKSTNLLNIGFSLLHDHLLHPEVSMYIINGKDTISEQGSFRIKIDTKLNKYDYVINGKYIYDWNYLRFNNDTTLSLYNIKGDTINYVRFKTKFKKNYNYPNPLYCFTREIVLKGKYILKDSLGNIITNKFEILENGKVKSKSIFDNYTVYYSTDIYCGPRTQEDFIMFVDNILIENSDYKGFAIKLINKNKIQLFERIWYTTEKGADTYRLSDIKYELWKK